MIVYSVFAALVFQLFFVYEASESRVVVTIEPPEALESHAVFDYKGVEKFDSLARGMHNEFLTDFGGLKDVSGKYRNLEIRNRDVFGGTHPGDVYPVAFNNQFYSITLNQTGQRGVNYFGYWLSALDRGNQLSIFAGETEIFQLSPDAVTQLVQSNRQYFGNPTYTPPQNTNEAYVFINFFCEGCTFDRVVFRQSTAAGYESDNHTVGYFVDQSGSEVTTLPPVTIPPGPTAIPETTESVTQTEGSVTQTEGSVTQTEGSVTQTERSVTQTEATEPTEETETTAESAGGGLGTGEVIGIAAAGTVGAAALAAGGYKLITSTSPNVMESLYGGDAQVQPTIDEREQMAEFDMT